MIFGDPKTSHTSATWFLGTLEIILIPITSFENGFGIPLASQTSVTGYYGVETQSKSFKRNNSFTIKRLKPMSLTNNEKGILLAVHTPANG